MSLDAFLSLRLPFRVYSAAVCLPPQLFVYTCAKKEYAEKILGVLDPQRKLFRYVSSRSAPKDQVPRQIYCALPASVCTGAPVPAATCRTTFRTLRSVFVVSLISWAACAEPPLMNIYEYKMYFNSILN